MDAKFKKKWVKALVSGEYKQCRGVLRRADAHGERFCCLGVARNILDPLSRRGDAGYLVDEHANKIGLDSLVQAELASMNDAGVPFEVIAGFIDQSL